MGGGLTHCPRSRDRDRRHAAQRIAAIGGAGGHDFRAGWRDRRTRRDAAAASTPGSTSRPTTASASPVEPHRLPAERSPATAGGAGTDVRGDRPDRSPGSPSSGTAPPPPAAVAAVAWQPHRPPPAGAGSVVNRCGGGWSAVADAPSAPGLEDLGRSPRSWPERRGRRAVCPQPAQPAVRRTSPADSLNGQRVVPVSLASGRLHALGAVQWYRSLPADGSDPGELSTVVVLMGVPPAWTRSGPPGRPCREVLR